MERMASLRPAQKVVGSTLGAAMATILIYVLRDHFGWQIPADIQVAITTVTVFGLGYFIPPSRKDQLASDTGATPKA